MRIGIVSDTHRDKTILSMVVKALEDVDLIIHLGDNVQDVEEIKKIFKKDIVSVKGNCDFSSNCKGEIFKEIAGVKFFITHGHKYDVKYGILKLKYRAEELGAEVVLFGHTHVSMVEYESGIWFINPGSASLPRDIYRSVGVIDIDDGKIKAEIKLL